jgi:hypothetical protein
MWDQKHFLTWNEAESWRKGEAVRSLGFCPVIKSACNPKCVCYDVAHIMSQVGVSTESFVVVESGCDHVMVSGSIQTEAIS